MEMTARETVCSNGQVPDAETHGLPGDAVLDTDLASASEHNRSASKAVAHNGPIDLEPQ